MTGGRLKPPDLCSGVSFLHLPATGHLADVAPTLLALMGLPKPAEMTGESLIA